MMRDVLISVHNIFSTSQYCFCLLHCCTLDAAFDFIADAAVGGGFGDGVVVVAVTAAFDVVAPVDPLSYFPFLNHLIHAQ